MMNKKTHDIDLMNKTYLELTSSKFPFYNNHFLDIVSLRAIDIITISKGLDDIVQLEQLKIFFKTFERRCLQCSIALYWSVFLIIVYLGIRIGISYYDLDQNQTQTANKFLSIFSFLGGSGFIFLYLMNKKLITKKIDKIVKFIWGYNKKD